MKNDTERGPLGAWARKERLALGLSVEQVVERLADRGAVVDPAYLRAIESGSKRPRQDSDIVAALGGVYRSTVPGEGAPTQPATDMGSLVSALTGLVAQMRRQNDRAEEAQAQMADALRVLTDEVRDLREALRAHEGEAGPHGATTPAAEGAPPAPRGGGPKRSQAAPAR